MSEVVIITGGNFVEVSEPVNRVSVSVRTGPGDVKVQIGQITDDVDIYDPNQILVDVANTDQGVWISLNGNEDCATPETGVSFSVPLQDVTGRVIGPMADSGVRAPMVGQWNAERITDWLRKANPSNGAFWIGIADGPLSEAQNAIFWICRNDAAGQNRVGLQHLNNGTWQAATSATNSDAGIYGVSGSGGSNTGVQIMNVLGFAAPISTAEITDHSYWIASYSGITINEGTTPYLVFGAGCDGLSDEIEFVARSSVIVTANQSTLLPAGSPPVHTPFRRYFPAFDNAVSSADPQGFIASVEDLRNGAKKINLNAKASASNSAPTDLAYWAWPLEDVVGSTNHTSMDLLDLRHWDGRIWIDILQRPQTTRTEWFVVAGIVHGSAFNSTNVCILGGMNWDHTWGWPVPVCCTFNDIPTWNVVTGTPRGDDVIGMELDWGIRGEWIYGIHTNAVKPNRQHYAPYNMAGQPTQNFKAERAGGEELHLVLAVGNTGGGGDAESIIVRPGQSFNRKRY